MNFDNMNPTRKEEEEREQSILPKPNNKTKQKKYKKYISTPNPKQKFSDPTKHSALIPETWKLIHNRVPSLITSADIIPTN